MCARGFVFSLDAFVAFVLIMITINLLIFTIGTPKPYYSELEAAHILAHDTLMVLATSGDAPMPGVPAQTYLERILGGASQTDIHDIMVKVAGGNGNHTIIPRGYGYKLQYLNLDSAVPGAPEDWATLYDAGSDSGSDRNGKNFTKLQASATTFLSAYALQPMPGESPFCHAGCKGYEGPDINGASTYASSCNVTPCDVVKSNFLPGENSIQIVRLVVYT